jgi:RHH-type transcriptional regulator, rel operon repressor / antitoxin RelB
MATSVRLSPETVRRLDRFATHTGRSRAQLIRDMVDSGIDEIERIYLPDAGMPDANIADTSAKPA